MPKSITKTTTAPKAAQGSKGFLVGGAGGRVQVGNVSHDILSEIVR